MGTSTSPQDGTLPDARWIYDHLMQHIEPDLQTKNIRKLDEIYKGETPEERKARLEQYALAFLIFEESLADVEHALWEDVSLVKMRMEDEANGTPHTDAA